MLLKDIIEFKNGKKKPLSKGIIPIYGGNGILDYTDQYNYDDENLIIGRVGAYCGCVYKNSGKCWISDNAIVGKVKEGYDFYYCFYLLKILDLNSRHIGSGQPLMTQEILNNIKVTPCTYKIQKKIGKILKSLDDKIEKNNVINNNLYEMMESIYKSWFVKFEPFKIDNFKSSELGEIPSNWEISDIYEIAKIIYGAPFKSNLFTSEKVGKPIIRIRDLKDQEFKTYTEEIHPKGYLLKYGDIAVGMDGEFKPYIWGNDEAWLNQRVCVFDNINGYGKAFVYYSIKPLLNYIEKTEVATTVIHIGKNDFDEFKIIIPPKEVIESFNELTDPMINKIILNMKENKRLISLRDTLLPKLMNGEIDLDNIEI